MRTRRLAAEESADNESRVFEEREAGNLCQESELFLARQMHAFQEEQQNAGMLFDDGAPVRLNVSLAPAPTARTEAAAKEETSVFGAEEEGVGKRQVYRSRRKPCSRTAYREDDGRMQGSL
jgi:hypothetical protein